MAYSHGNAPEHLDGVDSGQTWHSRSFQAHYSLRANFNVSCMACCWNYLVNTRNYMYADSPSHPAGVWFGDKPTNKCYLDGPESRDGQGTVESKQGLSVPVNQVNESGIILYSCVFSYCDAALHELYREREGKASLQGTCGSSA